MKISQMVSTNQILQTQIDELRSESEKDRTTLENEILQLKTLLADQDKLLEQLEEEKEDSPENEDTNLGTLESNNGFEVDFDSLMQSSTTVHGAGPGSPRHSFLRARMNTLDTRSRRVSVNKPPSHASEKPEPPAKLAVASKETQTVEQTAAAPEQAAPSAALLQIEDLKRQISDLEATVARLTSAGKEHEQQLKASQAQIEKLTQKLITASMESSEMLNEINSQYEAAMQQLKKAKAK